MVKDMLGTQIKFGDIVAKLQLWARPKVSTASIYVECQRSSLVKSIWMAGMPL